MYYTSLCAIAKDEDGDIREWVSYHTRIGFEHIYLFDNGSKNPVKNAVSDFVEAQLVTVIDFPLDRNQQLSAYYSCLKEFGGNAVWMGFIDIDEFIVPQIHTDIRDLLDNYTNCAALGIHWKIFGSSGRRTRPENGVIHNYTNMIKRDKHIKSIVMPKRTLAPLSPHHFQYIEPFYCVNEDEIPVTSFYSYHTATKIQINHYYYKSLDDYSRKLKRGMATIDKSGNTRRDDENYADFYAQENSEGENDESIIKMVEKNKLNKIDSLYELKNIILDYQVMKFDEFVKKITEYILSSSTVDVIKSLEYFLRYHNDMREAWCIACKVYIQAGKKQKAKKYISLLLQDSKRELVKLGYGFLMDYYARFDEREKIPFVRKEWEELDRETD
ncbi:hypothetical protein FACS1894206_04400 [Deltaproteobacteria bacterium]|nr:hypothetical protein FACS1894206_04400 [Deltaproteobacteria bacterium]